MLHHENTIFDQPLTPGHPMKPLASPPRSAISFHVSLFIALVVALASHQTVTAQGVPLITPIEGAEGVDWTIVNRVDADVRLNKTADSHCGWQTYDQHRGTDFVLRSFRQMDSGVWVRAAARGVVTAVVDSLPDRNKRSIVERGFGNYVALEHAEGFFTYYAHNRHGSARIQVGDTVAAGERLALVGSSGNSEDPHLHFEVWRVIDPLDGVCKSLPTPVLRDLQYHTTYRMLSSGLTAEEPALDTLREEPPALDTLGHLDTAVTYWSLQQPINTTDSIAIVWFAPDGTEWFSFRTVAGQQSNYFYWWSWIRAPAVAGSWTVRYSVGGIERDRRSFVVPIPTSVQRPSIRSAVRVLGDVVRISADAEHVVDFFETSGRLIASHVVAAGESAIVVPSGNGPVLARARRANEVLWSVPLLR
jgi:murein DD-endopeptidase MepM/ murein hydrolase activator NlpD